MTPLSGRIAVPMSEYDRQLVSAAGFRNRGFVVPSYDAAPVVTKRSALLVRALEGDRQALIDLRQDLALCPA